MRSGAALFLAGVFLLPATTGAETEGGSALAYCQALSKVYLRYIGADETYGKRKYARRSNLDAKVALAQCRQGDATDAIPVLERELINNGFRLPPRG